jgi:hypothetical protein
VDAVFLEGGHIVVGGVPDVGVRMEHILYDGVDCTGPGIKACAIFATRSLGDDNIGVG